MAKYTNDTEPKAVNLIAAGTTITGDLNSNSDIRIDGSLNGNLNTQGKVVIGESGSIEGEIHCKNCDISGKVKGKIQVKELLSLKSTSNINGDIHINKLEIEPGSMFTGNCNMTGQDETKQQKPGKEEKAIK